ncbi:MAG: hypothetical protein VKQ33_06275 [Candidatus Sericytochromatia bacterium]|nr:hypothetical protein [Candidatus Sericytochromatia bacterium]
MQERPFHHLRLVAACGLLAACATPVQPVTAPRAEIVRRNPSPITARQSEVPSPPPSREGFTVVDPFARSSAGPTAPPSPGALVFRPLPGEKNPSGKTTLRGQVYRADGTKIERGPKVTLITPEKVERTVDVENGSYEFVDLAGLGGNVTLTVDWYGMTPRTQRVRISRGNQYQLNFGEPTTETEVYGLSSQPEIVKVTPDQASKDVKGDKVALTLTLSEALNEVAIQNLVAALRLAPANETAVGGAAAPPDLAAAAPEDVEKAIAVKADAFPYLLSFFKFGQVDGKDTLLPTTLFEATAGYTVDGSARNLAVSFGAPLLNGKAPGRYQLLLAADPARPIKDVDGNLLGTDASGQLNTPPAAGEFLNNVFLSPYIGAETFKRDTPDSRWTSTHVNAISFSLMPDQTPPTVTAFTARVVDPDGAAAAERGAGTYLEFTFNEPIVALGPNGSVSRDSLKDISNYTFAIGLNAEYLASTALLSGGKKEGVSPPIALKTTTEGFGAGGDKELGKEFKLVEDGAAKLSVDIRGLNKLTIHVANEKLFDRLNGKAIMARVEGVHDPANNAVPAAVADKLENQPRGTIAYPATN